MVSTVGMTTPAQMARHTLVHEGLPHGEGRVITSVYFRRSGFKKTKHTYLYFY